MEKETWNIGFNQLPVRGNKKETVSLCERCWHIHSTVIWLFTPFQSRIKTSPKKVRALVCGEMYNPIGSMYGIYANIGGILMVNVTIYTIHGSYGNERLCKIFMWKQVRTKKTVAQNCVVKWCEFTKTKVPSFGGINHFEPCPDLNLFGNLKKGPFRWLSDLTVGFHVAKFAYRR